MRRLRGLRGCIALLVLGCASTSTTSGTGGAGGMGGAAPDLVIESALLPKNDCSGASDDVLTEGSWDLASGEDYVVLLSVENTLQSSSPGPSSNTVQVTSFEIALESSDGERLMLDDILNPYRTTASIIVPPATSDEPSVAPGLCLAIPVQFGPAIADADLDRIVLQIRATGTTAGGSQVSSAPFPWPVDLCNGCLRQDCPLNTELCTPGSNGEAWCSP